MDEQPTDLALLIQNRPVFFANRGTPISLQEAHPEDVRLLSESALPKRADDFLTGRACAREALSEMRVSVKAIPKDENGAPTWPPGIVGSITHTSGFFAAVVATTTHFQGIGIDAEQLLPSVTSPMDERMIKSVCHPSELEWLEKNGRFEKELAAKLLFSIRESFFKAVFPATGWRARYQDVSIQVRLQERDFSVQIESAESPLFGKTITGSYILTHQHVLTFVSLPAAI